MEALVYRSGDVEGLVAIKSKDLSNSLVYLEIAQIYKQAGDDEKALEWAEEGTWVFSGGGHQDLRRFLADEYHDRGRHEERWTSSGRGSPKTLVNRTNNKAYTRAYELILKVRTLMCRLGRQAEFDEYVELLRLEYKRKRDFMKLLDEME